MDNKDKNPGQNQTPGQGGNDRDKQPQQQGDKPRQTDGGGKSDDKAKQNR